MHSRPLLPTAEKILPFLQRIDGNRYYSNSGPLVLELEEKLSLHFGCGVVTTSSCTAGLTACLIALGLRKDSVVAVPSWTFVASAAAIVAAGHIPYFVDKNISLRTDAIMIVYPFGIPSTVWEHDIPTVIDGAASFDAVRVVTHPMVISTHATKVFSTGEGGLVLSRDKDFLKAVREICNFGINADREVNYLGFNGKMSEYSAAVGLAELADWGCKREMWLDVKERYEGAFFEEWDSLVSGEWASNVYPIELDRPPAPVAAKICEKGIVCRTWTPVHRFKAYQKFPKTEMTVTDKLAETTLLLPFSIDTTDEEIALIRSTLCDSL